MNVSPERVAEVVLRVARGEIAVAPGGDAGRARLRELSRRASSDKPRRPSGDCQSPP